MFNSNFKKKQPNIAVNKFNNNYFNLPSQENSLLKAYHTIVKEV